ncbi:hypothetical protein AVEN_220916-1 [Araneus ventricosus]|uniref:Uncharacterized protein n=1 Tax=Araneus ventricosus TaxID=182803 RepID=A0A4Y2V089_ARAVE|nr:hypothetical protein AVEN_220916-1 [Araneus ventricosus]
MAKLATKRAAEAGQHARNRPAPHAVGLWPPHEQKWKRPHASTSRRHIYRKPKHMKSIAAAMAVETPISEEHQMTPRRYSRHRPQYVPAVYAITVAWHAETHGHIVTMSANTPRLRMSL